MLILLLIVAIFLPTFDISRYRETIQETASRALGRNVVLQGEMSMGVSLIPTVVARDIRITNPEWTSRPYMASVDHLELTLGLIPLITGEIRISRLLLHQADILLEQDASGNNNWTFGRPAQQPALKNFAGIEHVSVRASRLAYLRADGSMEVLKIDKAESALWFDRPLTLTLNGQFRQQPIEAKLTGAFPGDLSALGQSWPFTLAVQSGEARLEASGNLDKQAVGKALSASVKLAGRNVGELAKLLNFTFPGTGKYALSAEMDADADTLHFQGVHLDVTIPGANRHIRVTQGEATVGRKMPLNASLAGSYGELPFDIRISGDSLPVMLSRDLSWNAAVNITAAQNRLNLGGKVSGLFKDNRLDLQLEMQGEDPRLLEPLFGMALPDTGRYHLRVGLSGKQQHYTTRIEPSTLGRTDVRGEITVDAGAMPLNIKAELISASINLDDFMPPGAIDARKQAGRPLLEQPLAFTFPQMQMDFHIQAGQILGLPVAVSKADLRGSVGEKQLRLDRLDVVLPAGRFRGEMSFEPAGKNVQVMTRLNSPALDISKLYDTFAIRGTLNAASLSLTGEGARLDELLKQSDFQLHAGASELEYLYKGKRYPFTLKSFTARANAGQPLELAAGGAYRTVPVSLALATGLLPEFIKGAWPLPVRFTATAADNRLEGRGQVVEITKAMGVQLTLELNGQHLESLEPVFDANLPEMGPYALQGTLVGGAGEYSLTSLDGKINNSDVHGNLSVVMKESRPQISATLQSETLHYDDVFVPKPRHKQAQRVIPDKELPEKLLRAVDVDIAINARRLLVGEVEYADFTLQASLRNGRLQVTPVHAFLNGGDVASEFYIDASNTVPVAKLTVNATNVDYGDLFETLRISDKLEGQADVSLDLSGTGHTTRELLASSNGHALMISGQGRIRQSRLDLWAAGLITYMLTAAWQPAQEAQVNCVVGRFDVQNGVARTDTLLFDTTRITVAGSGTLDLGSEELNAVLTPAPKNPTFLSVARPAAVTGTLAEPRVSAVASTGGWTLGGLLAGFASPATLLFSFGNLGAAGANPCLEAVKLREDREDEAQKQDQHEPQNLLQKILQPAVPAQ